MSTNLEYSKRESRRQASEAQREKERERVRARETQETFFLLDEQHENFVAAVRKWEMLAATKLKMSGSDKKKIEQEHVRHFLQKTCN